MGGEQQEDNTIMEEREELMVSPTGGNPTQRPAHFLKPSVTSIKASVFNLPSAAFRSPTSTVDLPLNVSFNGCRGPLRKWKSWVDRMHSLHQSTWKKVGIYEAIISSAYQIRIDKDIVLGFAEKWCSDTNTFVFHWGEGTITLEDVMVLGGYSVLGNSVLTPLESEGLIAINEKLMNARSEIHRSKARKACQHEWVKFFMDSGSEIEHEAFLVFWLSRHVFPYAFNVISKNVHNIAIHLARGTRIALAPAVLLCLYRDLRLLKDAIFSSTKMRTTKANKGLNLWAPMQFVQIWAWERFPTLRPKPNSLKPGEPRMARWNKVKKLSIENLGSVLDSAGECFQWRPYAILEKNWEFPKFYKEREELVLVSPGMDEDLESLSRFLRPCELVGLDCLEQYLPHRVAMQFGMDQDIPGPVARVDETSEIAWNNYIRPSKDARLYVPSRLFESDVTTRYVDWWKQSKLAQKDAVKGIKRGKRITKSPRESPNKRKGKDVGNDALGPPPKRKRVKAAESDGKDNQKLVENAGNKINGDGKSFPCPRPQIPSSQTADNGAGIKMESQVDQGGNSMQGEAAMGESHQPSENAIDSNVEIPGDNGASFDNSKGSQSSQRKTELPGPEIVARISKLEIVVARLKAEK